MNNEINDIKQNILALLDALKVNSLKKTGKAAAARLANRIKQDDIRYPNNEAGVDAAVVTIAIFLNKYAEFRKDANIKLVEDFYNNLISNLHPTDERKFNQTKGR
jgi:hypothetical protein